MSELDDKKSTYADWKPTDNAGTCSPITKSMFNNVIDNFPARNEFNRIVSLKHFALLKKIRDVEPDWDDWEFSAQIDLKARELGVSL